jgi:hypothetical protein
MTQGKNVVDAVKENGVQHLIFSGQKSAKDGNGKDGCNHFESKKAIYDYIVEQGELAYDCCRDVWHSVVIESSEKFNCHYS